MEIMAFDPGYATGICVGEFTEDTPLQLVDAMIIPYEMMCELVIDPLGNTDPDYVVSERFELIAGNEFTADLHAPRVEGQLDSIFPKIHWRSPSDKVQVPDALLQKLGWWKTRADVDWEDGRDANDAIIHMLGFVAFELNHIPTLRAYFREAV